MMYTAGGRRRRYGTRGIFPGVHRSHPIQSKEIMLTRRSSEREKLSLVCSSHGGIPNSASSLPIASSGFLFHEQNLRMSRVLQRY